MLLAGCGGRIVRLTDKGAYDEAIDSARAMKSPPKGKAARAFATALTERGRHQEARAVLLQDYRHGGDLRSLVALADLERALGLDGIAASHFGRVADLSREALRDRTDVCALLRRRATIWAAQGSGLAAEQDLDRAQRVCGVPTDAAAAAELRSIEAAVDKAAQAEVDARVGRSVCTDNCVEVSEGAAESPAPKALADARQQGPAALRAAARAHQLSLPPEDVVAILSADLRGEAGSALITDDEVRVLVGEQGWSMLAPSTMSQPGVVAAYVQLRLAAVMPDVPVKLRSRTGPGQLDLWLAQSLEVTDRQAWRVLAWAGDVAGAELALGSVWRPRRTATVAEANDDANDDDSAADPAPKVAGPPVVDGIEPPHHWTSRLVPTSANIEALLLEGRFRQLAGHPHHGLEIPRYVAARAFAEGVPQTDRLIAEQAAWHLAHGRPWHALAVASVVPRPQSQRVQAAAATALRMTAAFCGGACEDDRDRARVERTLGEEWVREQYSQLVSLSRARATPSAVADACPTLPELLAADATGKLAEGLRGALKEPDSPQQASRFGHAIEADLSLSCAGRYALPLMREAGHVPTAEALAESLAHDATLDAHGALLTHTMAAMVGERPRQAALLATATAAKAPDPAATWRTIARHAHASGLRELTLRSLREALMHTPGLADPTLRRALVVASLGGIDDGWNLRETKAGAGEPAAHVRDLVMGMPAAERWMAREQVARALAEQPWMDADARGRLDSALWPEPALVKAHPIARGWLLHGSGGTVDLTPRDVGPLDLGAHELLIAMRVVDEIPAAAVVTLDPAQLEPLRLAVLTHSRTWVRRWRTAVGLAVYGTPSMRARATAALLAMAEPGPRDALLEIVLEDPTVIEPADEGVAQGSLLAEPDDQLSVIFGLPFDPLGL